MTDELPENLPDLLRGQMCPQNCADDAPGCACALAELAADEIERMAANAAQHAAAIEAARREGWCAGRDAAAMRASEMRMAFLETARSFSMTREGKRQANKHAAEAAHLIGGAISALTPPEPAP